MKILEGKLKKILIIGGSEFIGSYLIKRLLKENAKIFNFDRAKPYCSHD